MVKKGEALSKNPEKCPIMYMFCPREKNNPLHFQNQKYIGIFMSLREREGGRERERERERGGERKCGVIIFLSRRAKMKNPRTTQERAV